MRNAIVVLALLVATVAPVRAQTENLAESNIGRFAFNGGNAVFMDSFIDDPAEYRGGAPETQRSLVKFSGDIIDGARRNEVVLVQFKQTGDGVPDGRRGGELYIGLAKPGFGTTDDAMHDALVATYEGGFRFNLPVFAPNLQQGQGTVVVGNWFMQSPDGGWRTYMQSDGNLVTYQVMQPGNWLCPRWSIFTGSLPACE